MGVEINTYTLIAIVGLICIIIGILLVSSGEKLRRKYTYPLLIIGGIFLEAYSIYMGDNIFIILQAIFIFVSIYGLIKINEKHHKILSKNKKKK